MWDYQDNFKPIYFFYEKILSVQKATKRKSLPLRRFLARKIVTLIFVRLLLFLLVGFGLIWVFVRSKSFLKKNKEINWLEIVLIASYTLLLTCTPINPPIENLFAHIYFHLRPSVRMSFENLFHLWFDFIWSFLSFHENKKAYEYHCLKQIFYHQNTIMIFCWFDMSWFALNSFNFMSDYFLVEQSVFESIKLSYNIDSFLPYWILYYQYFSWNTSLTFIQQIYQLFLLLTRLSFLPITFLWVGSKNFESWG